MNALVLAPCPRSLEILPGEFVVPDELYDAVMAYTLPVKPLKATVIRINVNSEIKTPQEYQLHIGPDGITIDALKQPGVYCAVMTLRQIFRQTGRGGKAPCLRIKDGPDIEARGVMLDISRDKVPSMGTLKRLLDFLSEIKCNQFQLYTEHTFAFKDHGTVWEKSSPMTAEEIREIDVYCRARNIELGPNQNSFGHLERWLKHPTYKPLAEAPDGFMSPWGEKRDYPYSLCPTDPKSVDFMAGLYDELLPNFQSRLFNVGCDETWDVGQGRSKEACEKQGKGRVYFDFLLKIHKLVTARQHTMMFWGDIIFEHPELIPELPKDIIGLSWGYDADHPFDKQCGEFKKAGLKFYVCPGASGWNTYCGRWKNTRDNLLSAAENGVKHGAAGFLNTEWGDNGHHQQYPVPLPGFLYGAAVAWCVDSNRDLDVAQALSTHVYQDPTGRLAKAQFQMADAYLDTGVVIHNNTIFAKFMFEGLQLAGVIRLIENEMTPLPGGFENALSKLESARALLRQARPVSSDAAELLKEMDYTARIAACLCKMGVERVKAKERKFENIPMDTRRVLADELEGLRKEFDALWLARNREGGLVDSLEVIDKAIRLYRA
ncbi:MAG: family 20 glycosylhydrolase [Fibrobacterota bacterium]